jgi:class 3 adenylate cyclase
MAEAAVGAPCNGVSPNAVRGCGSYGPGDAPDMERQRSSRLRGGAQPFMRASSTAGVSCSSSGENLSSTKHGHISKVLIAEFGDEEMSPDVKRASLVSISGAYSYKNNYYDLKKTCRRIVRNSYFVMLFMLLTVYALFVTDFDSVWGTKYSHKVNSIVLSGVFLLFFLELIINGLGRSRYVFTAYFWLDLFAMVSILPDTYFLQLDQSFASGRSTRLARLIRVIARSNKMTRLSRLARIVRVASLMPRLAAFMKHRSAHNEAKKMFEAKVLHIFNFLDEDDDGLVECNVVICCFNIMLRLGMDADSPRQHSVVFPEESQMYTVEDFMALISKEEALHRRLLKVCREQLESSKGLTRVTARTTEQVGVLVALGVLVLLFVVGLVEPSSEDRSGETGLYYLDSLVLDCCSNLTDLSVPRLVQDQVAAWTTGPGAHAGLQGWMYPGSERKVLYLDIADRGFCNEFVSNGMRCADDGGNRSWGSSPRKSLDEIDQDWRSSSYRRQDLRLLSVPAEPSVGDIWSLFGVLDIADIDASSVLVLDVRREVEYRAFISIVTILLVIVVIVAWISVLALDFRTLTSKLLKPLKMLAEEMRLIINFQMGAVESRMATDVKINEIQHIRCQFENMKKAIRSWGKYVPWPVVQTMLEAGIDATQHMDEKNVTVFFSDIESFTSIVESLHPAQSMLLLSRYFQAMSKVVDEHGGVVLEFIGDAIVAIYGAPLFNPNHADEAAAATLEMLMALKTLNKWSVTNNLPEVRIRCGIHTGRMLVGNMGFSTRMKYGMIGEEGHLPAKLEELNKTYGTSVLISRATLRRLDPELFVSRPVDTVTFTTTGDGQLRKTQYVFEVLAFRTNDDEGQKLSDAAQLHTDAMRLYHSRAYVEAAKRFQCVSDKMEELTGKPDKPSQLLMERCREAAVADCFGPAMKQVPVSL